MTRDLSRVLRLRGGFAVDFLCLACGMRLAVGRRRPLPGSDGPCVKRGGGDEGQRSERGRNSQKSPWHFGFLLLMLVTPKVQIIVWSIVARDGQRPPQGLLRVVVGWRVQGWQPTHPNEACERFNRCLSGNANEYIHRSNLPSTKRSPIEYPRLCDTDSGHYPRASQRKTLQSDFSGGMERFQW